MIRAIGWAMVWGVAVGCSGNDDPEDRVGNVTAASEEACGDASDMIPGLTTGWFVDEGARWKMQFSNRPLECSEPLPDPGGKCSSTEWMFFLSLPGEVQAPGEYNLETELEGQVGMEIFATFDVGDGCGGGGGGHGEPHEGVAFPGVMTINSVSDDCVTGEFRDLYTGLVTPPLDFDGAFHAVSCN